MRRLERSVLVIAGGAAIAVGFSIYNANASGFDNTGIGSMDLLFDPAKFALEFSGTYVNRNVDYESSNAFRSRDLTNDEFPPNVQPVTDGAKKVSALPDVWNYQVSAKIDFLDELSCLTRINNPGTILEEAPQDWNGRFSIVKTELQTFGFDATCAVKLILGGGHQFRVIGGARYLDTEINVLKFTNVLAPSLAGVQLQGSGWGWRAGFAYELPEYAIRASLIYDHEIEISATGSLETVLPLNAKSTFAMPSGLEFRVQTGIAPNWLAFVGAKWVNWSSLDRLTVNGSIDLGAGPIEGANIDRIFNFSDAWTVTAGIGHQLTEKIQLGTSFTWDQGIGGSYSDTYQWGLGGSYKFTDNVSWSLGGAVIYKTAAKNELVKSLLDSPLLQTETEDYFDLSYDASFNFALTSKLKLTF